MLKQKWIYIILLVSLVTMLAACQQSETEDASAEGQDQAETEQGQEEGTDAEADSESENQTISYLGEEYEVPQDPSIVITGAIEAMEDALLLDVEPIGAITVGGEFPEMFSDIVGNAESIGEKRQPNVEKILELNPDVILSTTKFPEDVSAKLEEITTVIPVSHISTNWKENLLLMGELTGKTDQAEQILSDYEAQLTEVKDQMSEDVANQSVVAVRIRAGNVMIYSQDTSFNSVLYEDLGLKLPTVIEQAEAQEAISLEKLSELNPDHIFVQYAESENADNPTALSDLEENPIWQSLQAVQNDQVYVNAVDPLAQGGTAWSKQQFLQAFQENVLAE
ncbi:iron-hydroxamate ABC transporter substrate-binding protein [Gracilibacillus salinarum]|uniref:Iron-hydroxamate ABC transporter substrate-binding protein n=1 Tax=Gracilibacillus salinarum TaxID=2932255 RepID=A0ABY4GGD2_9BACI|nr:iron-hydroxamate ABC transporter substrate-binding protein [Gracilibacillus salinarum]UOQ83380.1 iron-hydroxamate ABC transporter substrate-binding protein [Gracilibacillus salinarum]